tara:strand:+ start:2199 stop:3164 length:966 start_codon:yes stop_codon:yes gene_type:complete
MSVYTKITNGELDLHLKNYSLGKIIKFSGISEGIENSNYLLNTESGDFILTIFEAISADRVVNYLSFMNHVNNKGLLSPLVIETNDGELFKNIKNKPAALIQKLEGKSITQPANEHCAQLGKVLAGFHSCGSDFSLENTNTKIRNSRGGVWVEEAFEKLKDVIDAHQLKLIERAIEFRQYLFSQKKSLLPLPAGMIHADLFRDNILFFKNKISGIIDFYYSFHGPYIYDLAVVANDWCNQKNSSLDKERLKSLITEYKKIRKITSEEKVVWKPALVTAALRFYLSRLIDLHYPKIGELTHIKDPSIFENILIDRIENEHTI